MKTLKIISLLLLSILLLSSCKKDNIEPDPVPLKDLASEIAGSYKGSISHEGIIYVDAYTVTVTKIHETRVKVEGADERMPAYEFDIIEVKEKVGRDFITQVNLYDITNAMTYNREQDGHLTFIRGEYKSSFGGKRE